MATNAQSIKIKLEATLPLPETQPAKSPCSTGCGGTCGQRPDTGKEKSSGTGKSNCSDCSACGTCKSGTIHKGTPLLNHAAEALLNMAGGAYTLEQLSTALEIIETLLKRHYSKKDV